MGAALCAMGVKSYCAGAVTDAAKSAAASAAAAVKSRIRIPGRSTYTEERVPENYMAEYYMEEYTGSGSQSLHPEDLAPEPLPASKTSQPGPTSSVAKTAAPLGKSMYLDFPNDTLGFGAYPDVYDSPGLQEGGPSGTTRWARKRSGYLNNQPSTPGINLGDAMPLSPMVEHEMPAPVNTGLVILLTLLFITLVILKK
jgi:hypothetical protein